MKPYKLLFYLLLCSCVFNTTITKAQSGDQILDGIGETGLIARYVFNGNAKDWSRNNLHGEIHGEKHAFVDDEKFGTVLSLADKAYVSIPGEVVSAEESISVAGWVYLNSDQKEQYFFNFVNHKNAHFLVAPVGTNNENGFLTEITTSTGKKYKTNSPALEINKWYHIAIVLDTPSKSLRTYVNGKLVGQTNTIALELQEVFNSNSAKKNTLYIGESLLEAKLYDFRVYRIPLSQQQAERIYNNALHNEETVVNERKEPEDNLPVFSKDTPQLYNKYITAVPDIQVETTVGYLPRLPRYVKAVYQDGIQEQRARVLWPAPKDNNKVLKAGKYTVTGHIAGTAITPKAIVTVKEAGNLATPKRTLAAFNLNQVTLNADLHGHSTKFIENRDKFINTLANTNPDAFLYMFRNAFGQEQPKGAEPLGVWDSQETKLRGHATGHYLTAIAQAYASTGYNKELQQNFANKMQYMVNTLYQLSQMSGNPKTTGGKHVVDPTAVPPGPGKTDYNSNLSINGIRTDYWNWGKGFISAYPPDQFIMLENGATYGGQDTQVWAPYYTLHKIIAGLMDVYEVSNNEKALEIAKGMGDWVYARLSKLPTSTLISMWNRYIAGEFGGMNEAMARLYRITKDDNYLKTAQLFDNIKVFYGNAGHSHGLAKNVDTFRGLHANQHIPQIMGALEMYRDSHAPEYYRVADNFWYKTTNDYMYSIGGVAGARNPANAECFTNQPATLYQNGFSAGGQNETCATYNMLKLTRNLFLFDQRGELMDYYERGLYNHILASVAKNTPANTYHVPLRPGSVKHFGNPNMTGFTCCNGTALESSTKLQNSIYFKNKDNNALYVNLYVPSTLKWTEKSITVQQTTAFPKEDFTKLTIKGNGSFALNVRVPHWATKGFFVKINGKQEKVRAVPGTYLSINRKWKDGDTVELRMPFQFHLEPVMDQQNIASLFYGPVLLAAQETEPRTAWRKVTFNVEEMGKAIKGNPEKLEFTIDGVLYKPFYETYGRYSVYLDVSLKEQ
ncbi:beta-L-arabinofuranosidase domain-containing protein [Galbibacter pacificus]|uniref:Glycoside hydrolase family 127 protein n=1 Tax=Galbibacter pacificus TaxID=2996052 RepID=A0ABT6FR49_9FLAO|nr:beta-L-arabinofuranosidase domain-containing protein [Galbibacter pacificus]MDG3581810.1 glycoside hydrolase family 127 protein [Galbibacter pacificus]MDG3585716.1 glycoside hydrolase family 127 protein [Galbibacter pacificus]